jgi:hypothetical protein
MAEPSGKEGLERAPFARRLVAGLIDAAVLALPLALYRGARARRGDSGLWAGAGPPFWTELLPPVFAVVGEQLGTPGERLTNLRTVDRRTGRRLALWRTLAVALGRLATRQLVRRAVPRPKVPSEEERKRQLAEMDAIRRRHADDPEAANSELMRHYAAHRVDVSVQPWAVLTAGVGSALVNRGLRRRLAPTVVVMHRRDALAEATPHRP